ncbi:hypothetical protein GDO86_020035 [Hymenochirus boettgeri]|uniref:Uncharacterized protein n=1 Tax=Hymenochirus boettgeri TaxID=247094 RepID=A0A8T2IE76_9PIPI|nr:hypothetical protein GDO86_020035 [Hymenochirus boettgeri]
MITMSEGIMSKAATMEIPISRNGVSGALHEDESLEQDLQQVMVSGPNLNETSIVSGGYGGTTEGIIPTGSLKGPAVQFNPNYLGLRLPHAQTQGFQTLIFPKLSLAQPGVLRGLLNFCL